MQGMDHGGSGGNEQASGQATPETTGDETSGMDMGGTTDGMGGMEGMDHGSMDMSAMSREMVAPNGE
jgi:hypothetical protein